MKWRPCILLQRATTAPDEPTHVPGQASMGNLEELFSVLVLVAPPDSPDYPQRFFAGERQPIQCVVLSKPHFARA